MATKAKNNREINREIEKTIFNDTERFEFWFVSNWRKLTVVAVAAAAIVAVIFGINASQRAADKKAAAKFADAANAEELAAVIAENSDRPGVQLARYRLAAMLLEAKKSAEAVKELNLIAADTDCDPSLRSKAMLTVSYVQENNGKTAEAAAGFKAVFENTAFAAATRCEAGFAAGRNLLALGKTDEAVNILRRTSEMKGSGMTGNYWSAAAGDLLRAAENGELKKK